MRSSGSRVTPPPSSARRDHLDDPVPVAALEWSGAAVVMSDHGDQMAVVEYPAYFATVEQVIARTWFLILELATGRDHD